MTRWQTFLAGVVCGALAALASLVGFVQWLWERN